MKRHIKFLKRAQNEALKSTYMHQIGCVLVSGSNIISTGYNQIRYKGRGIRFTNYPESLHAERDCLSKVNKEEVSGATLYIWREGANHPMLSKPCENCWEMIKAVGCIKRIVYTTSEFPYYKVVKL